jgi:hypothetical protein
MGGVGAHWDAVSEKGPQMSLGKTGLEKVIETNWDLTHQQTLFFIGRLKVL